MFVLFFLVWLLLSGEVTLHSCLWGLIASALITWFCRKVLRYRWHVLGGSPVRVWALICYFAHLLTEMLKAGWMVMQIIYTRPREIEPKLIWFDIPLKEERHVAMLSDSITLTAGTITVRTGEGKLLVHTLDVPLAEGVENSSFQQRLKKMEDESWKK